MIEPYPEIRSLVELTLRQSGHEVETAADGEEALRLIERGGFDCVIIGSPVLVNAGEAAPQGRLLLVDLLRRRGPHGPDRPCVIVLTTHVEDIGVLSAAARFHACAVIAKPFTPDALLDTLALCLSGRHAATLWLGIPGGIVAVVSELVARSGAADDIVR